ncbi:hypothetical protein PSSHI_45160 [Photobacterium sp. R1]
MVTILFALADVVFNEILQLDVADIKIALNITTDSKTLCHLPVLPEHITNLDPAYLQSSHARTKKETKKALIQLRFPALAYHFKEPVFVFVFNQSG